MKIFQKILRTLFVMVMLAAPTGSALAKGAGTDGPADFDRAALIQAAIDNQVYSYAPYSKLNVSAAVLTDSGKVYLGVNVENASFPVGVCAEHNAIDFAVGHGEY